MKRRKAPKRGIKLSWLFKRMAIDIEWTTAFQNCR